MCVGMFVWERVDVWMLALLCVGVLIATTKTINNVAFVCVYFCVCVCVSTSLCSLVLLGACVQDTPHIFLAAATYSLFSYSASAVLSLSFCVLES